MVLGNCVPLWEIMLAAIRIGAVIIPATPQLSAKDLADRVERGDAKLLVGRGRRPGQVRATCSRRWARSLVGARSLTWATLAQARRVDPVRAFEDFRGGDPHFPGVSKSSDPLLLYFTSGTTALPKLVEHTHVSYPIGHLSTMYWMGLQPGDVHLNISSPGWAKHAWSNFFAPWLAGATVLVYNYARFDAGRAAGGAGANRRDDVLRAAHGVADADPGRPGRRPGPRSGSACRPVSRSTRR